MAEAFRDCLKDVKPIKFREPLAETLGAFTEKNAVLDYSFIEAAKMAGHACPTVSAAYLITQKAVEALYPGEVPVRGEIAITVYGEADDGVYGVIGQVLSFLTGAAPASGFRGLGHKFKRKDLLRFDPVKPDTQAMTFEFKRLDTSKAVLVKFYPGRVPQAQDKAAKISQLMEKVLWEADREGEKQEFQDLWMEKVKDMLIEQKEIDKWLKVEERRD